MAARSGDSHAPARAVRFHRSGRESSRLNRKQLSRAVAAGNPVYARRNTPDPVKPPDSRHGFRNRKMVREILGKRNRERKRSREFPRPSPLPGSIANGAAANPPGGACNRDGRDGGLP